MYEKICLWQGFSVVTYHKKAEGDTLSMHVVLHNVTKVFETPEEAWQRAMVLQQESENFVREETGKPALTTHAGLCPAGWNN